MVEIWGLGVDASETYARAQKEIQAFQEQYHLPPQAAKLVAVQTVVLDFIPKFLATTLLLGTYKKTSWPRFSLPANYYVQRFTSSYVAPSLGPVERQKADVSKIDKVLQKYPGDEEINKQGQTLIDLLGDVEVRNTMVDFAKANMLRFVQA